MYRVWREHCLYGALAVMGRPALLTGAGEAGMNAMHQLSRSADWRLAGELDDSPSKHGREMTGLRIVGAINELEHWARELKAKHAIGIFRRARAHPWSMPQGRRACSDRACAGRDHAT